MKKTDPPRKFKKFAFIKLRKGKGKQVLCAYDDETHQAFEVDYEGRETTYEYFNFVFVRFAESDEIEDNLPPYTPLF